MDDPRTVNGPSRLPAGLTITGELTSGDDIIIEGTFDGQITMPDGEVSIGNTARVKAKIVARRVVVAGRLQGTIVASDRVILRQTAVVAAHLQTPSLGMLEGAQLNGTVAPDRTAAGVHVARYRQAHPESSRSV